MRKMAKDEKLAIAALKRLAKRWPKTLWLYAANGTLDVMRFGDDGETVMTESGGVDPDWVCETIRGIRCDGGDW